MALAETDSVFAICCRPWPVGRFYPIGACRMCKTVPVVDPRYTEDDYYRWKKSVAKP